MSNIEPGKNVYAPDGQRGEYVSQLNGHHLVRPIARFTDWDGEAFEEPLDTLALWSAVYPKAPVAVVDEEVAKARQEVEDARKALLATQREIVEAQREHAATLARLKNYEPLKNLEPLLTGEITHVVEGSGYGAPVILPWAEAVTYRDDYSRKDIMRMLSLKPTADGVISWHLNRWSDGSGVDTRVILCTSEDEAREAARGVILEHLGDSRVTYETHPHLWLSALQNAARLGIELPEDVVALAVAFRVKKAREAVDKAAETLREAEAGLVAAQ